MKQVNPTEARQGREGKPILMVLLVSIVAALAVWILVEIYGAAISPDQNTPNGENSLPPAATETVPPASAE
ncbi:MULTISPECIES: hypothetical protein [Brucella/Ochrobactrum group]|jgi:hypothetical protein|uniref:Uncharacterized protein n=1 Tax=Brucella pseudintermedia TaxID=370111 RepID=A0ABY5UFC0_9HYPH|nr:MULTISPECIES: hypothetical protein [Brucella/Ochrobactrum group]KAB2684679.1 hypothetical protein F9K78_03620 [Brucella pseudintermedia]MCO7728337.1 hypothetical protein [Brucella intermedia]NKE74613.1 hypothetical protein [Ochrobactrum sp. MC-1LL]TWG97540.1 hypothetical protein L614_000500000320 [Ochrobactrum sp. J50]UWL62045.1 hypothetical protein NIK97_19465 [Brucella pseudintermedia]